MNRPADSSRALAEIRTEVRAAGLDREAVGRVALELALHLSILAAGLIGFFVAEAWPVRAGSLGVAMLGHVGVTTSAHTTAHRAASSRRWVNDLLAFFSGGFVSGISFTFWHDKHNRRHHGAPNVSGIDPDHDFAPFLAVTERDLADRGRFARAYYRWQWLAFPFLLALMFPRTKAEGWTFAVREAFRGGRHRAVARLDVVVLCGSTAAWWGLPLLAGTVGEAVLLNVVREVTLSYGFFLIFAPAHMPREAVFLERRLAGDFMLQQTATTLNYRVGRVAGFFLSGLQYQIEHHLLRGVPHVHYAKISPIVESACRRHGYPYRVRGWSKSLRETLRVLRSPKPSVENPPPGRAGSAGAAGGVAGEGLG